MKCLCWFVKEAIHVVHARNLSTQEAGAKGLPRVPGQTGQYSEVLLKPSKKIKKKNQLVLDLPITVCILISP